MGLTRADIGACIKGAGTAALRDIGVGPGAIAATRRTMADCPVAAGNSRAKSRDQLFEDRQRIKNAPLGLHGRTGLKRAMSLGIIVTKYFLNERVLLESCAKLTLPRESSIRLPALSTAGSVMFNSRAPGEIIRPDVNPDRSDEHQSADPEPRRMMNAPPVAAGCLGPPRVSMVMFFIHGRSISSEIC